MWKMLTRPPRAIVCPHAARSVARNKRCGAARHSPHPAGVQSHAGTRESLGRGGRWALSREMRPVLLPSWQAPVVLHECVARSFHGGRSIAADVAAEPSRTDRDWDIVDEEAQAEMWRKLYARDYTEKADLAKFLAAATELVEERQAKRDAESRTGGDLAASLDDDFAICSTEHGGYELPAGTPITLEVVHEMVRNFVDGQRLRRASLVRLLDEGQAILAACPNITLIPAGTKTCVIGDLHGDFDDLLQVFELVGWPGEENTMVFNGDFVDRGDRGIECLALLLALKICHPMHVHLNRGNHEDSIVGRAYGFFEEVMVKYGQVSLYQRIGELFCHLPLCAVLEKEAFIVHAGVPSEADATIYHIGAVARSNITSTVAAKWAASRAPGAATARPRSLQLVEDLLWSDPVDPADEPGAEEMCERNMMRGAGCRFGPALVQRWLKKMELFTLVRSHECVEDGWRVLDCGANTKLYTVFSNANYQGGGNSAAVLVFPGDGLAEPDIIKWQPSKQARDSLSISNRKRIADLICQHKAALRSALDEAAHGGETLSVASWSREMRKVLKLDVDFAPFATSLAPVVDGGVSIEQFLSRYRVQVGLARAAGCESSMEPMVTADEQLSRTLMQERHTLLAVFRLLDDNGDGFLSRAEVQAGCALINERLAPELRLDADHLFGLIDADGTGFVSVAEFVQLWS